MGKKAALERLQTMLTEDPLSIDEKTRWRRHERNPFEVTPPSSDHWLSSPVSSVGALTDFRRESDIDQLEENAADVDTPNEESSVEDTNSTTDAPSPDADEAGRASQRAGVAAFQAAISEARQKAETQLRTALEQVRQEEAKRHSAEVARLRQELERQHDEDLQRAQNAAIDSINALTGTVLGNE